MITLASHTPLLSRNICFVSSRSDKYRAAKWSERPHVLFITSAAYLRAPLFYSSNERRSRYLRFASSTSDAFLQVQPRLTRQMSATSPASQASTGAIGVSLLAESRVATDSTRGSTGSTAARSARSFTSDGSSSDRLFLRPVRFTVGTANTPRHERLYEHTKLLLRITALPCRPHVTTRWSSGKLPGARASITRPLLLPCPLLFRDHPP